MMSEQWHYQLRVYLSDEMAELARKDGDDPLLQPLNDVLRRHRASLVSQFDAFAAYVAAAEEAGAETFPLYKWTKATLDDPARRAAHIATFALRITGEEVYDRASADALEADLQPLVGGALVTRMSRHDTDPANNLPIPARYRA